MQIIIIMRLITELQLDVNCAKFHCVKKTLKKTSILTLIIDNIFKKVKINNP